MTGVLVDTSVWVSYFRQEGDGGLESAVREILLEGRVRTCWPVQAEVLVGARDSASFDRLQTLFDSLIQIPVAAPLWRSAAQLGFTLRRQGLTVPLPDLLIAQSAMDARCELWHADSHYEAIRRHVDLRTRSFLSL
jgi:predicted nucleic acid-binding protein